MHRRRRTWHSERFFLLLQPREAPATLGALLTNMLLADSPPQDIVICKAFPFLAYLSSSAERSGIEVGEDPEGDFMGKNGEGVYTNDVGELVDE